MAASLPRELGQAMSRAIEVAADIDLTSSAHRREGRAKLGPDDISLRVAVAASVQGSKLSIRLLEASRVGHDVTELGMAKSDEKALLEWAANAEGMVLSVGPTGCGKTTTAITLGAGFAAAGFDAVLLDTDTENGSALAWAATRKDDQNLTVVSLPSAELLTRQVPKLRKKYDIVLIDGGANSQELLTATVAMADFIIVPTNPAGSTPIR